MNKEYKTYEVKVSGLVQGVGFRPYIYRLANEYHLKGTVDNRNDGVMIVVRGPYKAIQSFLHDLPRKAPRASMIESISYKPAMGKDFSSFSIIRSSDNNITDDITEISPDIAVCEHCLKDMKSQPQRLSFPFTNCTNCGPRFSIIKALPYDRPNTTMQTFAMCPSCEKEYTDINDRRFHAQPVACKHCGPQYTLHLDGMNIQEPELLLEKTAALIDEGQVLAAKGLGGYNLICDALNPKAVHQLRQHKHRDGKPLALMFKDIDSLLHYAPASEEEMALLQSWRRPIVLIKTPNFPTNEATMGFKSIGAMLPYLPFHHLLFEHLKTQVLVYTSANLSGEPIIKDNKEAMRAFFPSLSLLSHNRDIYNRVDDSVAMVVNKETRLIRRSRSWAPSPVRLPFEADGLLATGAELVNTFCIGRTSQAILSQHIGDLKNAETLEFFEESITRFQTLYKFKPKALVCDMHPDYLSSVYAQDTGLPLIKVQHHHAHMASVMAENKLDEKLIGIILDGTGLGLDGKIWGGEFLVGNLASFHRYAHFDYLTLPGGDKAVQQPWRLALSLLYRIYGHQWNSLDIPFVKNMDASQSDLIIQMIDKKINCPESSSAGRLFDAIAALTGLCRHSSFHAEAPMRLEDRADFSTNKIYPFDIKGDRLVFQHTVKSIVYDLTKGVSLGSISAAFHRTMVLAALEITEKIRSEQQLNKVVLSGGSFQNRFLSAEMEKQLRRRGFEVFVHHRVPSNDGGLSLGQLAVAAKQLSSGMIKL